MKPCPFITLGLLALGLSAGLVSGANYPDTVLADDPIAYWRFNDGITAPVLETAANLGSLGVTGEGLYVGALHPVPGALAGSADTAAQTDGTGQAVQIPFQASLNPAAPFSLEAWLKPALAVPPDTQSSLAAALSSAHVADPRSGWLIYQSATGWNLRFYAQAGTASSLSITGGGALMSNTWYHVVATYDGTTTVLYVNGAEAASGVPTGFVPNVDGPFTIGRRSDGAFAWAGDADEVAFYDSALSVDQVLAHYNNGIDPAPLTSYDQVVLADNPLGYWRLNEPTYVPPAALNSGSLGAAANGAYNGGAYDGSQAPQAPAFPGFESDNTAVELNGTSGFVSTVEGLLNSRPQFTLSGWLRRNADQANRTGLWGQNDLVEFGYIDNNTIQAWTDNGLNVSPNPFPNEEWSHLALVSDGPTIAMYTNGLLAATRAQSLPGNNNNRFNIGGGGVFDTSGNFFNGQIDEVAVFDKALPPERIAAQYFSTVPGVAPGILRPPSSTNLFAGDTIALSVAAYGSAPLRYQWVFEFFPLPDETNSTLVIENASEFDNSGLYWVEISNDAGGVVSDFGVVVVDPLPLPSITEQPQPATRYGGASAIFGVAAVGGSQLTYQWQFNETDIPGATSPELLVEDVDAAKAGPYRVVLTNPTGTTYSDPAVLTVLDPAPGYEAAVVGGRPLAYWRLGETSGSTAYDYWGGHDGAYTDVLLGADGALINDSNPAAEFNGTSSAVTTPFSLNDTPAFTVTGWIQRGGDQANRTGIFGQNDLLEFGYINNDTLQVWTDNGLDITPNPFPNGEWSFLTIVSDGPTISVYTNADPAGSRSQVLPGNNGFGFNIGGGGIFDATGNFFLGRIDEVAVFDRPLSQEEICSLYRIGSERFASACCNDPPSFDLAADTILSEEDNGPVVFPEWAFNISAGPNEPEQTVQFFVSNDNPDLFVDQPAISPDGTLTYESAPNLHGQATVEVYLQDDGGTEPCGNDTSEIQTFEIVVQSVNDCPVAEPVTVSVNQDASVNFNLVGSDPDGDPIEYVITQGPAHGTLVVQIHTGAAWYTPAPGYCGPESFKYKVTDGQCDSPEVTVSITVVCLNQCPTAVAHVSPACTLWPDVDATVVLSINNTNATVVLNGTESSDPDGDPLTYTWILSDPPGELGQGPIVTTTLEVGSRLVTLVVNDGRCDGSIAVPVEVITVSSAVDELILLINDTDLSRKNKQPLIATLKAASASFERGAVGAGLNQLNAFQNKARAQLSRDFPDAAAIFIEYVEEIKNCVNAQLELNPSP